MMPWNDLYKLPIVIVGANQKPHRVKAQKEPGDRSPKKATS